MSFYGFRCWCGGELDWDPDRLIPVCERTCQPAYACVPHTSHHHHTWPNPPGYPHHASHRRLVEALRQIPDGEPGDPNPCVGSPDEFGARERVWTVAQQRLVLEVLLSPESMDPLVWSYALGKMGGVRPPLADLVCALLRGTSLIMWRHFLQLLGLESFPVAWRHAASVLTGALAVPLPGWAARSGAPMRHLILWYDRGGETYGQPLDPNTRPPGYRTVRSAPMGLGRGGWALVEPRLCSGSPAVLTLARYLATFSPRVKAFADVSGLEPVCDETRCYGTSRYVRIWAESDNLAHTIALIPTHTAYPPTWAVEVYREPEWSNTFRADGSIPNVDPHGCDRQIVHTRAMKTFESIGGWNEEWLSYVVG